MAHLDLDLDLDWNGVPLFVHLARTGSMRRTAEALGVGHPTVRRRLAILEESMGHTLFHRRPDGLHPTLEGEHLLEGARDLVRGVRAWSRSARALDARVRGPMRVSTTQLVAGLLAPDFAAFSMQWPQVDLTVDTAANLADLARMEADVAIRLMPLGTTPPEELAGRRAVTVYRAEYGHEASTSWLGAARDGDDSAWLSRSHAPSLPVRGRIPDPTARARACAAGMGRAWLPCFLGDGLAPRRSPPEAAWHVWVLVHPDLRRSPFLRAFRDAMVEALGARQQQLHGAEEAP
jgi:DNA-binding transcriptional LysR family regulator